MPTFHLQGKMSVSVPLFIATRYATPAGCVDVKHTTEEVGDYVKVFLIN